MAKKPKISFSPSYSSGRYQIIYAEMNVATGEEIKRNQYGQRYSDWVDAFNFLAGHYHNHSWGDGTTFDGKTGTITQKVERHPNVVYKWFIEDMDQ